MAIPASYGALNLGDEAIPERSVRQLRASLPVEITVRARDDADTLRRRRVEHVVPARQTTPDEARADPSRQVW